MLNLTKLLEARKDAYAARMGEFVLAKNAVEMQSRDVYAYLTGPCQGMFLRVVYLCLDGKVRDIIGRSGVWQSEQDGEVQGIGRAMRNEERETVSFWTCVHNGEKANTGAGKGYRTLRAAGILALRIKQGDAMLDIVTSNGAAMLAEVGA